MLSAIHLALAVALDFLIGDPPALPHPVRAMGTLALWLETRLRRLVRNRRLAGVCTVLLVLLVTGGTAAGLLLLARRLPWPAGDIAAVIILYYGIAARDMLRHSRRVYAALAASDLPLARRRVAMIVGRDTANMDEEEIVRATVESVAENLVDGVSAPLFFAMLGGPVGIMLYKASSTMDSVFGYKNDRYREFGWAAARLDDLLNFVPARLTGIVMAAAAALAGLQPVRAYITLRRDRLQNASPNSGHSEAAMAGALGVQLGGPASYFGAVVEKPVIGRPGRKTEPRDILLANRLFLVTTLIVALCCIAGRIAIGRTFS